MQGTVVLQFFYRQNAERSFALLPDNIKYIIFDMDGTLLDSLSVWADSDCEFITGLGYEYDPAHSKAMKTMHFDSACEYLVKEFSLPFSPKTVGEKILEIVEERYINHVSLKPGAEAFINAAEKRGIKMCVATSNKKKLAEDALNARGILGKMEFVLTSDEVGCGKESPEIFLKAAEMLGGKPCETAVFEDSLHAVISAKSAGFFVAGMFDSTYAEEFLQIEKIADISVRSFEELLK